MMGAEMGVPVHSQKPEKGIRALLMRARQRVESEGVPHEQALEEIYQGAVVRTERRIELLNRCNLRNNPS